jgi:hypothetical protein
VDPGEPEASPGGTEGDQNGHDDGEKGELQRLAVLETSSGARERWSQARQRHDGCAQ